MILLFSRLRNVFIAQHSHAYLLSKYMLVIIIRIEKIVKSN